LLISKAKIMVNWLETTLEALQAAWGGFITFLPNLIGAIIVFVVGWFVSAGIGKLLTRFLNFCHFNQFLERFGWKEALEKAEIKFDASKFLGIVVKWCLVIVFLMAAADILGLEQFSGFLGGVLGYVPNIIIAVLIFIVATIIADILEGIVKGATQKAGIAYAKFLGELVRWAVLVFAAIAIFSQLGVAATIINALVVGFIGMLALAGGLAFGLGGKDEAHDFLKKLKKKVSEEIER